MDERLSKELLDITRRVIHRRETEPMATGTFPTMDGGHDSELTQLALDYVSKRDKRMAAGKLEKAAKNLLIDDMQRRGLTRYHDDEANFTVTLEVDVGVRVTTGGEDDDV